MKKITKFSQFASNLPKKGTVAHANYYRNLKTPPIEPKDQMVGTAKVTKEQVKIR